jgi:hypothetical protein
MPKIVVRLHDDLVKELRAIADERGCTMTEALRWAIEQERAEVQEPKPEPPEGICGLCGKPLPESERMFKYHGYSGPCPSDDNESSRDGGSA